MVIPMSGTSTFPNNNLTVVRVVFSFYPIIGGSVTHISELSKIIDPYLNNQIIIAPKFEMGDDKFDTEFGIKICRIKYYNLKKLGKLPVAPLVCFLYGINVYFALKNIKKPYIIHAHGIYNIAFCWIISKFLNVPIIGMLHGSAAAYSKISELYETLMAKLFKPYHAFVLDDGSPAPDKFKKLWGSRVTIVNHGIDTNNFVPMEKNREIISKLGLKHSDFIVLSTSSLNSVKNIDLLLRSFHIFITEYDIDNARLVIVGDGPLKESLIHLSKELGLCRYVFFLGSIDLNEITKYISIADVVAATSLYSNLNRSVQEAMSCEKAVVVFDSGNTSNLIKHLENGVLVESGEIRVFAEYLSFLYEDKYLKLKLGKKARKTILETRSWDYRIKQELKVYEELL